MKLNRRKFLEFLGKITAVSGIALVVGLPEVSIKDDPDIPVHFEDTPDEIIVQHDGPTIATWNGNTWSNLGPPVNTQVEELHVDANGILYAGGSF